MRARPRGAVKEGVRGTAPPGPLGHGRLAADEAYALRSPVGEAFSAFTSVG